GGVPKSRQPGCRHGQVRSCTDRVQLHRKEPGNPHEN
ncbi:hypothetical protein GRJ2_003281200, partial [Grus japonensis]